MKRTNGEGTIYKVGQRFEGQFSLPNGKRKKIRGSSRAEVLRRFRELQQELDGGLSVGADPTVSQALDYFVERVLPNRTLAPATRDNYEAMVAMVRGEFGKIRLRELSVDRVDRGLDRIATGVYGRGRPLSKRTMKLTRGVLSQALDVAVRNRWVPFNAGRMAELPPTALPGEPRRSLTVVEAKQLWKALDGERLGNLFRLMLSTGLRPGEALGLCWDAVEIEAPVPVLHIRRTIRRDGGRAVMSETTKTTKSRRTLRVPAPAVDVLRAQRKQVAEIKLAARTWVRRDHELVFPTPTGAPWNPATVRTELLALCERIGIDPAVRPHELRHSAASLLLDAGVSRDEVAQVLGHSGARMLDETYGHPLSPIGVDSMAAMQDLFG